MSTPTAFDLTVNEVGNAIENELRRSINPNANDRVRMLWKQIKAWAKIGHFLAESPTLYVVSGWGKRGSTEIIAIYLDEEEAKARTLLEGQSGEWLYGVHVSTDRLILENPK